MTFTPFVNLPVFPTEMEALTRSLGIMDARLKSKFAADDDANFSFRFTDQKTGTYTAKPGEIVLCEPTVAGFTVHLPPAATHAVVGRWVIIKNDSASTNTITIDVLGDGKIDGAASKTITTARGVRHFASNGLEWKEL